MWTFTQSTGALSRAGEIVAHGYSGHGEGVNNHAMQSYIKVGPIPVGRWQFATIANDNDTGPFSIIIWPEAGTETFGRSGFRCHGDNHQLNHSASEGCIILPRAIREAIWASNDRELEVVA